MCESDGGCGQQQRKARFTYLSHSASYMTKTVSSSLPLPLSCRLSPHNSSFLYLSFSHHDNHPLSLPQVTSLPPLLLGLSSANPFLISVIPSLLFIFCFTPFFYLSFSSSCCFVSVLLPPLPFFTSTRQTAFLRHRPISIPVSLERSVKQRNKSGPPLVICFDSFSQTLSHSITSFKSQSRHSNSHTETVVFSKSLRFITTEPKKETDLLIIS